MNGFLLAAAVASLIVFLAHLFWGGYEVAKPLLNAPDIQEVPKLTAYYCWHIATILLFVMTCAYAYVALLQPDIPLTVAVTSIAGACVLLNIGLIAVRKLKPLDYPQWAFFIPITVFGVLGLFSS
ncbi:MAG: hypothetical protein HC862_08245 [Scytonema sp. RU_4_4]|nr:hypothetical protein [Scytonema sp. RU_4_4]NJR73986.1 hypothetical protein [Scytonema sp. CRU_2_7]